MPVIRLNDIEVSCETGENLREVLLRHKLSPYSKVARHLNCRGLGTCGTCALRVSGKVSPMTKIEKWRLDFPPHKIENDLRLACQCSVLGNLTLTKHPGFWGEQVSE